MKTVDIKAVAREGVGKAATKKVRREGMIPATVYGLGDPENVSVDYQVIKKLLHSPETFIVNLDKDGAVTSSIIRETQFHPVTDSILHVDFLRVDEVNPVEVQLPIRLVGTSKGVLAGGKLVPLSRRVKVRGIVTQLPEFVDVDITNLELGQTITVAGAGIEGLDITSPASMGVAIVDIPRAVRQAQQEAAKAEA